jgi:hypothetical protein
MVSLQGLNICNFKRLQEEVIKPDEGKCILEHGSKHCEGP